MSRIPPLFIPILDAIGDPVVGGLLYTYEAGTTTNLATYSDEALTVPNANPLIADAAGLVGPIYMTPDTGYKFVEKDASDVTLRTQDDVFSNESTNSGISTRIKQLSSCPLDYGAIGDGIVNDTVAVQAALDDASGWVDLAGKTYKCNSGLSKTSGPVKVRNGTLDFTACTDTEFFSVMGSLTTIGLATVDIAFGDSQITLETLSGLSVGDLIHIYDSSTYTSSVKRGELAVIESLAGLVAKVTAPVLDEYTIANGATIRRVNAIEDVEFDGVTFIGTESIAGTHYMLALKNCRRVRLHNVRFENIDSYALLIAGCYDVKAIRCSVSRGQTGVYVVNCSQYISLDGLIGDDVLVPVFIGANGPVGGFPVEGPPRFITIRDGRLDYQTDTAAAMLYVSNSAQHVYVLNNILRCGGGNDNYMIEVDCVDVYVEGNTLYGLRAGGNIHGIEIQPIVPVRTGRNYVISIQNNTVRVDGDMIAYTPQESSEDCIIAQLLIENNRGTGKIGVNTGNANTYPDILDLRLLRNITSGILEIATDHLIPLTVVQIAGNIATGLTISGDVTGAIGDIEISDNRIGGNVLLEGFVAGARMRYSGGRTTGTTKITSCANVIITGHESDTTFTVDSGEEIGCELHIGGGSVFKSAANNAFDCFVGEFGGNEDNKLFIGEAYFVAADGDAFNCEGEADPVNMAGATFGAAGNNGVFLNAAIAGDITNVNISSCRFLSCATDINLVSVTNARQGLNDFGGAPPNIIGDFTSEHWLNNDVNLRAKRVLIGYAALRALHTTPIEILAGIAGKVLCPIAISIQLNYNSIQFALAGDSKLQFRYEGGPNLVKVDAFGFLSANVDLTEVVNAIPEPRVAGTAWDLAGDKIEVFNTGTALTNGNSTVEIILIYIEVDQK